MNSLEREIVDKIKQEYLFHIDNEYENDIFFYDMHFGDVIDCVVGFFYDNNYNHNNYKRIVETIGTFHILSSIKYDYNIYDSLRFDEGHFYFDLLYSYIHLRYSSDINLFVKEKHTHWKRLHYNRFLQQSNLPNEICSKIREHL